jgi:hypothetical protein
MVDLFFAVSRKVGENVGFGVAVRGKMGFWKKDIFVFYQS